MVLPHKSHYFCCDILLVCWTWCCCLLCNEGNFPLCSRSSLCYLFSCTSKAESAFCFPTSHRASAEHPLRASLKHLLQHSMPLKLSETVYCSTQCFSWLNKAGFWRGAPRNRILHLSSVGQKWDANSSNFFFSHFIAFVCAKNSKLTQTNNFMHRFQQMLNSFWKTTRSFYWSFPPIFLIQASYTSFSINLPNATLITCFNSA